MNADIKKRWVDALRGDKYKQTTQVLHKALRNSTEGTYTDSFCCLGVLCDLHIKHAAEPHEGWSEDDSKTVCEFVYLDESTFLPEIVRQWSGMEDCSGDEVTIDDKRETLASHNDNGCTFAEIADAIESQL